MAISAPAPAPGHGHGHDTPGGHSQEHSVPLWGLFLALLALTAAELVLYEFWRNNTEMIPKFAVVLLILLFTLPKALIVLIWFMHLKFERQFVIFLAIAPFVLVGIAILPTLTDTMTLKPRAYYKVKELGKYQPDGHGHEGHEAGKPAETPATSDY